MVTIAYNPVKGFEHLARVAVKGFRLVAGEESEVTPEVAGDLLRDFPGCIRVTKGEAAASPPALPAAAKALQKAVAERQALFGQDPSAAIDAIPQLSRRTLDSLSGANAVKDIEAGKLDKELSAAAIYSRLGARKEALAALIARQKALTAEAA